LFSAGGSIAGEFGSKAAAQGAIVIDNSSRWRMESDVPLIVPEVNPEALKRYSKRNIIANPNCSTAQLVMALKPLHDVFKIKRVVVSTYQSVSGAGSSGMDELFNQTRAVYVNDPVENTEFSKQIAFNCIPHIDVFMDDGFTKEEWKMAAETRKILDPDINVVAHCVRVPVFIGHAEAVFVETNKPIDEQGARDVLSAFPGVIVVDHRESGGYVTPQECAGEDAVYISRLRLDPTVKNGLVFWCVSDNLRKGAALNAVQIAETLVENHLNKTK
jgi:aspartate-semialdehyde dehydrogenase